MRQKEMIGAFVRVPIDDTYHTYSRIINKLVYAFYDFKTTSENPNLEQIERANVLFKLIIHISAINKGGWRIVGVRELPEDLKIPVPFFKQEIGNHNDCSIVIEGHSMKVTREECRGWKDLQFGVTKMFNNG